MDYVDMDSFFSVVKMLCLIDVNHCFIFQPRPQLNNHKPQNVLFSLQDCITFMQSHHATKRGTRNETLQVTEASKDKMMDNDCFVLLSFAFSLSTVMQ